MDIYILNNEFKKIGLVDNAESVLWNKRYIDTGDFEIYVKASSDLLNILTAGEYVRRIDDDMVGIIETIKLTTDEENGDYITVTGRDLKALLARRIVWTQTMLSGTLEKCITKLLNENVISPSPELYYRRFPNFEIDQNIKGNGKTFNLQTTGDNLLDVIQSLCTEDNMGFKILLTNDKKLRFTLYSGSNYTKSGKKVLMFSPDFENLYNSEYVWDKTTYANAALVAGEGEGKARKTVQVFAQESSEVSQNDYYNRFEIYIDSRNTSSNDGEISEEEYNKLLFADGQEALNAAQITENFTGDIVSTFSLKYGKDYMLGDIVIVENEYKVKAYAQIVSVMEAEDENGKSVTPEFSKWRLI